MVGEIFSIPACCRLMGQSLAYTIHLIVMPTARKAEKLIFENCEPRRLFGKQHAAALNFSGLNRHSDFLVMLRFN